jgi:hypothetical protein
MICGLFISFESVELRESLCQVCPLKCKVWLKMFLKMFLTQPFCRLGGYGIND